MKNISGPRTNDDSLHCCGRGFSYDDVHEFVVWGLGQIDENQRGPCSLRDNREQCRGLYDKRRPDGDNVAILEILSE